MVCGWTAVAQYEAVAADSSSQRPSHHVWRPRELAVYSASILVVLQPLNCTRLAATAYTAGGHQLCTAHRSVIRSASDEIALRPPMGAPFTPLATHRFRALARFDGLVGGPPRWSLRYHTNGGV